MAGQLFLVPTELELERLRPTLGVHLGRDDHVEVCGFGLVASAARSAQCIASLSPRGVILLGLAGTYTGRLPVGRAIVASHVRCQGIGAGGEFVSGEGRYVSAGDLGWFQFAGTKPVGDTICLNIHSPRRTGLLSVAAASATTRQAADRHA